MQNETNMIKKNNHIKQKVLFFISMLFLTASCVQSGNDYLKELIQINKSYKSVHFKVNQKYYYLNGIDTIVTPFEVWAVRVENDSLRAGFVWVDNNYRPYNTIYEKGNYYLSIPPKKTTVLYKNYSDKFISSADWIDVFLKPDVFNKILSDSLNHISVSDTLYQNKQCKKLVVDLAKKNDKQEHFIYILNENFLPLWAMYQIKTEDYTYFDELSFSDYSINKVDLSTLKERQKKVWSENPLEKGTESEFLQMENMLHVGDEAPLFDGLYYATDNSFKLADFIGEKVIIVDFWYTHCPPCVRAMPELSKLNDNFKDKGLLIFGLNSVDNEEYNLPNLKKFLKKRKVSYDIILTQSTVDLMYKIKGYPTMYVIDKSGKIAYLEIGFDNEKFNKLKAKVEELLNE